MPRRNHPSNTAQKHKRVRSPRAVIVFAKRISEARIDRSVKEHNEFLIKAAEIKSELRLGIRSVAVSSTQVGNGLSDEDKQKLAEWMAKASQ